MVGFDSRSPHGSTGPINTAQVGLEGGPGRPVARPVGVAVLAFRGRSLTARAGRSERASPAKFMLTFLTPFRIHATYIELDPFFSRDRLKYSFLWSCGIVRSATASRDHNADVSEIEFSD